MNPLPHHYSVHAVGTADAAMTTTAPGLTPLELDAPAEFGGPGDQWSPETLLGSAVAGCFVLTFRAVARAMKLDWLFLECDVTATLDRLGQSTQFTHFVLHARLQTGASVDHARALLALEKAHRGCLVANSLKGTIELRREVVTSAASAA